MVDLYRYSIIVVISLMGYVSFQQLSVYFFRKQDRIHLYFSGLAFFIFLQNVLFMFRVEQSSVMVAHSLQRAQWFISWLTLAALLVYIDMYIFGRLHKLAKAGIVFAVATSLMQILLPYGGLYSSLPVIEHLRQPWGEEFFDPSYHQSLTLLYPLVLFITQLLLVAAFIVALRHESKSPYYQGIPYLTIAVGLILLGVAYDIAIDLLPSLYHGIRLRHATTVMLLLIMDTTMIHKLYRVAKLHTQLKENEEQLQLMVDNVPGVLYRLKFLFDGSSELLSIRGRIQEVLGEIPPKLNVLEYFTARLAPKDRDRCKALTIETRQNHQPFNFEGLYLNPLGEQKLLKISSSSCPNPDGSITYSGVILDETQQWLSGREHHRLSSELQQSTEELESMLYVTSHDLKAPLLNIRGFSSELKTTVEELKSALPNTAEVEADKKSLTDCLQFIDKSAGRMGLLLDGLLLVSRSRRIPMEISRVSVSQLLTSVLEIHQFRIRQENATILISELPDCMGDLNMLTQVWSNLIDNSLKYKHPDRAPLIRIEGRVEEDSSIYTIRDNGLGFATEHAANLFQLFHRLNPSKSVEGTGIGLTVVKRFLQRMGGSIEAIGWPGQGAEFVIRLPLPDTIISA